MAIDKHRLAELPGGALHEAAQAGAPWLVAYMHRAIERLARAGKPFLADPILEPIHFGFVDSIARYREVRARHPEIEMMMGTGNLTELTEADSLGVTALQRSPNMPEMPTIAE